MIPGISVTPSIRNGGQGDDLHAVSDPNFLEKYEKQRQFVVCWIYTKHC